MLYVGIGECKINLTLYQIFVLINFVLNSVHIIICVSLHCFKLMNTFGNIGHRDYTIVLAMQYYDARCTVIHGECSILFKSVVLYIYGCAFITPKKQQ